MIKIKSPLKHKAHLAEDNKKLPSYDPNGHAWDIGAEEHIAAHGGDAAAAGEEEVTDKVDETPKLDLSTISVPTEEEVSVFTGEKASMDEVEKKYKKLVDSGEYNDEQLDSAYIRLLDEVLFADMKIDPQHKANYYQGIIKEREDKREKEKIKNKGAINVGFGSTPSDHIRSSQNPSTPTIALTEEDYIVKYSDGGYDYSTTVDEALAHNVAIDKAEGTDDPFGLQGGENHFQIVLKTHKKDSKTIDSDGSSLIKPVDVSSYADEIGEIINSDLGEEEKEIRIGYIVDRYEDFLDLDAYHETKKEIAPIYEEYEELTGRGYGGSIEDLKKELKIETDKRSFAAYVRSTETAQDMSGLYYSPNIGWMDKATVMYKFEEWITQDDVLETIQFGISEDMETNFQVHGEQWMHDNMVMTPDQVGENKITTTTKYNTEKALSNLEAIGSDGDTSPSEITEILTGGNLSKYNLVINNVDNSHYTSGDYVQIYMPSLIGPLSWGEDNPGSAYKKGDFVIWAQGDSWSKESLEMILKELDAQTKDERGNITLLNSLLQKSTKSGEKPMPFDKMLDNLNRHQSGVSDQDVHDLVDEGFNNFFEGSGLTLEYKGGGLRQLVLKRNGEEVKRFKHGWEVISYLSSKEGVTKKEMNALYKNGLKYQNSTLVNPVKEYREKLEREESEKDITDQEIVVKFLNNIGVEASKELSGYLGLDPNDVRIPIMTMGNMEDIAPEFANRRGNMSSKSIKWWADKKANGNKMDFEDFYEDVWNFSGVTRPYDKTITYSSAEGEALDRGNAKKAWAWLQELDRQYDGSEQSITESLYNTDYNKKITTFIQNRKDGKHQIAFMDFGVAMYDDGEGNITPATEKQIKEDIEETLDVMSELVLSNQTQVQDVMQDLADNGWMPGITVNEETGDIKLDQVIWEGEGEEPDNHPPLLDINGDPVIDQKTGEVVTLVDHLYDAISVYHDTREEISAEIERIGNQQIEMMGNELTLDAIQSQEFFSTDYWENFWRRAGRGSDNVLLTIPALLGNESAIDQLQINNKAAQREKSYEWGEGNNWGAFGMVWADQGANMIYFVSTLGVGSAVGFGTKTTMAIASGGIALQSMGGKDVQLKTLYENAEDALLKLDALNEEYDKGFVTDETYLLNKQNIDDIVRAADISAAQHFFSVLQTGLVEGTFTYGFGLLGAGRLNTARNLQKVFANSKSGLQGTMSYNPYIATRDVITGTVRGTVGEIAEESSIYLTTEFIDSYLFDRKGDYSQLSKVMIDAAVMSSSMNSMSLTANAVINHNMKKETRDEFNAIFQQINDIKGKLDNDGNPTPGSIMDIDLQIKKAVGNPQEVARLEELRKVLNDEVMQLEKKNFINWQNFHVQVLGMNEADQKTIFENEKALNKYYVEAGVTSKTAADETHVEKMLQLYKARLNKKKKGSGDAWYNKYHEIKKSNEELKDNFDMETAAKAIYGPNYKDNGGRKEIQNRIKNDKTKKGKKRAEEYDRADEQNKLRLELEYIQQSFLENATSEMKDNDKIVDAVETNTGDAYYEVDGNVYETKKDFIDAVKKAKEGEGEVVIKVENDDQASILSDNIMSQNSNNDVTVEDNNYNSDGAKVISTEEEIETLEREATEEATGEKIEGEVDPSKRKVTILNDKRHQTEEQWENKHKNTKNYKYKRHQRDRKQKEIYDYLARTHYAGGKKGLQTFQEGKINSKNIAEEVKKSTGKDLVFDEVGSVDGLLNKINELAALPDGDPNRINSDQQTRLREQVENNRKQIEKNSNGFILGNTFFVINEKQAKIRMGEDLDATGEGSFLQGAAWMHEMGHYLDNVTKTIEEISQKGIYLHEFLSKDKNKRAQILNEAVESDLRRMSDGEGFYLKNGETIANIINERKKTTTSKKRLDRIDQILDEYIREVTTKISHSKFAKLRQDVTERGRSTFPRFRKDDYTVKNAREAAFEVVSFLEDFKKGRISESYRVQVAAAKNKKGLAGDVRSDMQQSVTKGGETIEQSINNLVRNTDGSLMTKEEYDALLDKGVQTKRRRDKKTGDWVITKQPHPANLLTSDPNLPGNDWLNGSIRNLGTRMEGSNVIFVKGQKDPMSDFMQAVKDKLTTAITNYNPETKYQGAAEGDLSGWLAQTIIYKKPGVIDDFRKLQETRAAAEQGGDYKGDGTLDVETVEGTVVFAKKLGFTEDVIGQDENGNDITRNVFDSIVEEKIMEIIALDPKTYKDTKSLIKAKDAVLVEILNLVAEEFGVKPSKLIDDASLTTGERTSMQLKINSIGARSMLNMMPEGFNSLGDANGVQPVFLDGKKGKAINSETGETNLIYTAQEGRVKTVKQRIGNKIVFGTEKKKGGGKGLKIQKKNFVDNINEADYLDMLGITPVGVERRFRTEDRIVDGPLRASVMQVAMIIANQSITKIAGEKGLVGLQSMKDGKGDLMLSSIIDASGQDAIQNMYWDGRNEFHGQLGLDGVILDVNNPVVLKQQITTAFEKTWPNEKAWIGDDKVDYKGKLINWYSKILREKYIKYTDKSVVIEGQDTNSFLDFLMAEDAKRDDVSGTVAKIMEVESITPWIEDETNREDQRKFNRTTVVPYIEKIKKRYPKLDEEQIKEKVFQDFYSFRGFLNSGFNKGKNGKYRGSQSIFKNNDFYTENLLNQIYPNIDKVIKIRGKNLVKITFKNSNETKTIEILQEHAQKVTKEMIATTNKDGNIDSPMSEVERDSRKQLSDEALRFTDDIFEISAKLAKDESNNFTKMNFAALAAQMNSHPTTPLRMGAVFTWAALDPFTTALNVDGKRTFEFEHGMPARIVNSMFIMKHWFGQDISLKDIKKVYEVGALHVDFNENVSRLFGTRMNFNYQIGDSALKRWYSQWTKTGASHALYNVFTGEVVGQQQADNWKKIDASNKARTASNAIQNSRVINHNTPSRGASVFDFDETVGISDNYVIATKEGETKRISSEEWPFVGERMVNEGWKMDFTDFNRVTDGRPGPLMDKLKNRIKKFGPENNYILTARASESETSIHNWLKEQGINIPLKNITGLGNSTGEAKAMWIAGKYSEGYNDMYFVDDALPNVRAVKNMMEQLDIKGSSVQAKINFSSTLDTKFNDILESTTGIESQKRFSEAQAKLRGNKGRYKGLVPASAQDFLGLLYNFIGKGKKGDADMVFFKEALIDPFARAINELNASRQSAANDYKNLTKQFPKVKKRLNKKAGETGFTNDQAVRVYLWNKAGFDVPGLSKRDLDALDSYVKNDSELQAFADNLGLISKKQEGYSKPGEYWLVENIASDLMSDGAIGDARAEFLAEWKQNVDQIFSPENLNKIESIYGSKFREALVDILTRMETGRNRSVGSNRLMNNYMNWVNNSVGAIMFFNIRSAVLQTISATNYINWTDNNPLKAAAAFANQKQFWSDFVTLFNSDYLKQRRSGNRRGVNEADLSAAVKGVGPAEQAKAVIRYLLKIGFLPTQIADSFAIASGGAAFYRNRVKTYVKQGMSKTEAETKAFLDFQERTEVSQQSARPDMISQQQANPLGRLILAFQNTPMQYGRIMNKAFRDIANGRGDTKTHMSKIIYYGGIQAVIFGALQAAIFASLGDDEEEEFDKKKERILNGMIDSWLSTFGYGGKAVSTMKRSLEEYLEQKDKGYNADHAYTIISLLSFSPPISSKLRKIYSSIQTEKFNEGVFTKRGFTLDNPLWSAIGNTVEGITNIPLGRISQKLLNIDNATDSSNEWWERVALVMGWNTWDLGIKDKDIQAVKEEIKEEKKIETKKKREIKKEEKKKEKEEEEKKVIEDNIEKQKKEKKDGKKDIMCAAVSKSGKRCKTVIEKGSVYCTIHVKVEQNKSGKNTQCKKMKQVSKKKTERCGMMTNSKSGYCYYHD